MARTTWAELTDLVRSYLKCASRPFTQNGSAAYSRLPWPQEGPVNGTSTWGLRTREPAACRLPEQELLRNLACRARDAPCPARPSIGGRDRGRSSTGRAKKS